jgi:tRNA pseudouridine55 synthase
MHGIFLIDKSEGMTSFDVIRTLKKQFNLTKIGHAGTLDPFATGLMIILVGHATKLSNHFIIDDKVYETTIQFGTHTSTYDYTGDILKEKHTVISKEMIEGLLPVFEEYDQEPPMVSAIKVKGKKLYELARQGKVIEREKRPVRIYKQDILSFKYPTLKIRLHVSKGTYIRSYAVDLAEKLGTYGHLSSLRRLQSGPWHVSSSKTLEALTIDDFIPISSILKDYPKITVTPYIEQRIKHGLVLDHRQFDQPTCFCVYNTHDTLIAFYEPISDDEYKIVFYNEAI